MQGTGTLAAAIMGLSMGALGGMDDQRGICGVCWEVEINFLQMRKPVLLSESVWILNQPPESNSSPQAEWRLGPSGTTAGDVFHDYTMASLGTMAVSKPVDIRN